jgi:hypothetical protein
MIGPVLLGSALLLSSATPSHAFLQTLFGPPKVSRGTSAKVPEFLRPLVKLFSGTPRHRRVAIARARPAATYASIRIPTGERPSSNRLSRRIPSAPIAMASERQDLPSEQPVSDGSPDWAFLNDSTLRRGDIVVFADGPRVFSGDDRRAPRHVGNFENLATSGLVDEATRQHVLAATAQAPATEVKLSFRARPRARRAAR